MWLFILLVSLIFLALIVGGTVLLVRAFRGDSGARPTPGRGEPRSTPLSILEERYARGEIDREEFEERRRTLGV